MRSPWSGPKATQKVAPPMGSARRLLRSLRTVIVLIRHPLQLNRGERQLSRARRPTIRVATPTRAGEASSRASSVPTWRLGMPCEGSLRDAIRLAALAPANLVVRPDRLGMEAGAPGHPPADGSVLAAVAGRRTAGVNPLTPVGPQAFLKAGPRTIIAGIGPGPEGSRPTAGRCRLQV
jgi:hypothetical protein